MKAIPLRVATASLCLAACLLSATTATAVPNIWINEIHYDNVGGDADEFVEVAGPAGLDLSGFLLQFYNGSNGEVYDSISLTGAFADQANGFGFLAFFESGIQNGSPDGLALIDSASTVIQFLSYEGSFTATESHANGQTSADIGVSESNNSTPAGHSLQLGGTGSQYADFSWQSPLDDTPGQINANQTIPAPTSSSTTSNSTPLPDATASLPLLLIALPTLLLLQRNWGSPHHHKTPPSQSQS